MSASARRFVRFGQPAQQGSIRYGLLDGDSIRELTGAPFAQVQETGARVALADVKLLCPTEPQKILAVGRNYRSHLGTRPAPEQPELFWKPTSALQNPDDPILLPAESTDVHFEGELVLVIGRTARNVPAAEAGQVIFGVTCGNDVSERQWQAGPKKDLQWWRAKGADTFAPCGPAIATGLNPDRLLLRTRLNGEVVQEQSTSDLLFDCAAVVSFASRFVTLQPGDLIYTGTPGHTRAMKPGDVVEVEIEGVGLLRNPVRTDPITR
jgi:2-keto-4-pentenoate hydratase/2-oxohepta-3-ene-1,7-dioic acid hydratase in catechol pathway